MHKDLRYIILGVNRQTISEWETDETLPDIWQSKRLALYGVSLDELMEFDLDIRDIQDVIDRTSQAVSEKIDWTKAWSKKYPVLARYQSEADIPDYAAGLWKRLIDMKIKKSSLTEMAGVSASTIAKLSHDEYVSLEILERICRALHCEIGDVVELRRGAEES